MKDLKLKLCMLILTLCTLSGCYRMPTENDYSLVPSYNNTDVTRGKPGSITNPAVPF